MGTLARMKLIKSISKVVTYLLFAQWFTFNTFYGTFELKRFGGIFDQAYFEKKIEFNPGLFL